MAEIVEVPVADLLLDSRNARLSEEQSSQQAVCIALAAQQGRRLVELADDIVHHGLDPMTMVAVVPTSDQRKRYLVLEGNRRVLALKALDTPGLVSGALAPGDQQRLNRLASLYQQQGAIETLTCLLFRSEDEARHWIELRHTGQNEGRGLVEWGSDEKDRYAARHGSRSPAGQLLDFVKAHGNLSEDARTSNRRILTSLKRLIGTPEVRGRLGIEIIDGEVYSSYPMEEVLKGLTKVADDFLTGAKNVGAIYTAEDRLDYARSLPGSALPRKTTRLPSPVSLSSLGTTSPRTAPPAKRRRRRSRQPRTSLVPSDCRLNVDPPRINAIFNELTSLSVEQYPNAVAVLLRVFLELSVSRYLADNKLMSEQVLRTAPLAKKLKEVGESLRKLGKISQQQVQAVRRAADSSVLAPAKTNTLHLYVHNEWVYPKPSELRTS